MGGSTLNASSLGRDLEPIWDFPKMRAPYFGVLIIGILLFSRVLY